MSSIAKEIRPLRRCSRITFLILTSLKSRLERRGRSTSSTSLSCSNETKETDFEFLLPVRLRCRLREYLTSLSSSNSSASSISSSASSPSSPRMASSPSGSNPVLAASTNVPVPVLPPSTPSIALPAVLLAPSLSLSLLGTSANARPLDPP